MITQKNVVIKSLKNRKQADFTLNSLVASKYKKILARLTRGFLSHYHHAQQIYRPDIMSVRPGQKAQYQ
jgi:hypothetical protein